MRSSYCSLWIADMMFPFTHHSVLPKITLNCYYSMTHISEVYRIAMGMYLIDLSTSSANCVYYLLVLHPQHKLSYFKTAKWESEWIQVAKVIVHSECEYSYKPCEYDDASGDDDLMSTIAKSVQKKVHMYPCVIVLCTYYFLTSGEYIWHTTSTFSTKAIRAVWQAWFLLEHWSWACNWCPCLVGW